jgi:hypothetical protein
MTHTKGGVTLTGEIMDITLHVGGREFFQLSGKDKDGDTEDLATGVLLNEVTSDPHIATVTPNPANQSVIAIDGISPGQCVINISLQNPDLTTAQPVNLNITVLAQDVVEVDVAQIGGEGKVGDPFPS